MCIQSGCRLESAWYETLDGDLFVYINTNLWTSAYGSLLFTCSVADRPLQLVANDFTLEGTDVFFPQRRRHMTQAALL